MKLALPAFAAATILLTPRLTAQHTMAAGATHALPAQAAYGAIQEIVRQLKADPATDWSKVNLEALRQHLIDMDDVTMRSAVVQQPVPGGLVMTVTGAGRTGAAIKRVLTSHAAMLGMDPQYTATATPLPAGIRLTVTAKDASDTKLVAMIRGLGFAGLITEGDHHAEHHMMVARGSGMMHSH